MKPQSTTIAKCEVIEEKWYLVDADQQVAGRVAARVASLLRGKREATYSPHQNPKVHVVVINAEKVVFTGAKLKDKVYYNHSGWRTGINEITAEKLLEKNPTDVLTRAIYGMLPKNRLGAVLNKNVRIYAGSEHPHAAQNPETLEFETRNAKSND